MMAETVDDVAIPEFSIVFCPMKGKEHRLKSCAGCENNRGMVSVNESDDAPFMEKYRLICAAPMARKITVFEG